MVVKIAVALEMTTEKVFDVHEHIPVLPRGIFGESKSPCMQTLSVVLNEWEIP